MALYNIKLQLQQRETGHGYKFQGRNYIGYLHVVDRQLS